MVRRALPLLLLVVGNAASCGDGQAPTSIWLAEDGSGPRVLFDLLADPLPEIPLPNDVGTWADPTSITGIRVNVSKIAPTGIERRAREKFDRLPGWGTYTPVTVQFDAPIDVRLLIDRFRDDRGRSDFDFSDDPIYVVDLQTGVPVPLDVCDGNFPLVLEQPDRYYPNDPRGNTSNLVFEVVEEDLDGDWVLDPGEDTDFDGVLDHPNIVDWNDDGFLDPDRELVTCYEFETNTLILRPLVPMNEAREYAVVLTNRLRGLEGRPVQPPDGFPYRHHIEQTDRMDVLSERIRERPNLYGGLSMDPEDPLGTDVAFAWTFTTQTTTRELRDLREGLYGRGPFARIATEVPAELTLFEAVGIEFSTDENCPPEYLDDPEHFNVHIVRIEQVIDVMRDRGQEVFDIDQEVLDRLLEGFRYVDYIAIGTFETPFLLGEDKFHDTLDSQWDVNSKTGEIGTLGRDLVNTWIAVPKRLAGREPPFPVAFYGHGYTGPALEMLGFAGNLAKFGIASVGVQSVGHGMGMDPLLQALAKGMFDVGCAAPVGENMFADRSRDLNADGVNDSGGDFWTAYTFHTRDVVRQSVLDWMQAVRIFRSYDGTRVGTQDFDGDGEPELAGDFDADGVVDIGGPDADYYAWGQSLGGIESMIAGSAEPAMVAAAPTAGSGGLIDVGVRSTQGGVKEAVILRLMGPLVMGFPASEDVDGDGRLDCAEDEDGDGELDPGEDFDRDGNLDVREGPYCANRREDDAVAARCADATRGTEDVYEVSRCPVGTSSLRFFVPDLNDTADIEFGCAENVEPGNDVMVANPNGEVRCAAVSEQGTFRIGIPADVGDPLDISIWEPGSIVDYGTCQLRVDARHLESISEFGVRGCFQGVPFIESAPLVSIVEGYGMRRGTPTIRRFLMLAQLALEPGDPVSWARGYFMRSAYDDDAEWPSNLLNIGTVGDMNVPINTAAAFGRAAGLIPFIASGSVFEAKRPGSLGPDAFPEELLPYVSTEEFEETYDGRTPNQVLIDTYVLEGLERLERFPGHPTNPQTLFDVDDLDENEDAYDAPRLMDQGRPPLRLVRDTGSDAGMSGQLFAYIDADGEHGFYLSNLDNPFDIDQYMINLIGRYFQTSGREIYYAVDPEGHHCLEDDSCDFIPPPPPDAE